MIYIYILDINVYLYYILTLVKERTSPSQLPVYSPDPLRFVWPKLAKRVPRRSRLCTRTWLTRPMALRIFGASAVRRRRNAGPGSPGSCGEAVGSRADLTWELSDNKSMTPMVIIMRRQNYMYQERWNYEFK